MWTPRRIVLLTVGFVCYFSGYLAYGRSFLGAIDGLPGLPEEYRRQSNRKADFSEKKDPRFRTVEDKLKQAFGMDCPELRRPIKLELHSRSMALASDFCEIREGKLFLKPISVALFGKDNPEINTIRGNDAYLTFDRPLTSMADINGRKLTAAELHGPDIVLVNNRRTDERTDDISLHIGKGPLYYSEEKHKIWTSDMIYLVDLQSKPKPIRIWGTGMELDLMTDSRSPKGAAPRGKPKQESITGIKQITLHSNVLMFLYAGANSAFPAGDHAEKKKPEPAPAVEEKAEIRIQTPGRFTYEFAKDKDHDVATFEVVEKNPNQEARIPQDVEVTRRQPNVNGTDNLVCQKLVLKLRSKQAAAKQPGKPANQGAAAPDQNMQIETVHATGPEVTLTSDAEKLEAYCVELIHNIPEGLTILRGNPQMRAFKDGNVIHAQEVQIKEVLLPPDKDNPQGKKTQLVNAKGPGQIDMIDKDKKKANLHALWTDRLTSSRDGPYDLLVLTGNARFVDDEHDQFLQAETLKVWLEDKPASKPRSVAEGPAAPGPQEQPQAVQQPQQNRRPHHLEALTNVLSRSPELNLHDSSRLVVWFKDVPEELLPASANGASGPVLNPAGSGAGAGPSLTGPGPAAQPGRSTDLLGSSENREPGDKKEPPRPIDLTARMVEAEVLRTEAKSALDKLWCEGYVRVHQDPAKPDEKGVYIEGEKLQMKCHPDGNRLLVTSATDVAKLRMDKIYILGPEVNIDQAANKAWVDGPGAMQMDSNTTFDGNKMEKTVPLTIHWSDRMFFFGKYAEFHGGIQADQGNSLLTCQSMQVFFDRPISLKEGNKTGENPVKVQTLMCDRSVRIEETVKEGDRLVKYQLLTGVAVETYSEENEDGPQVRTPGQPRKDATQVKAAGPGSLRIYQAGGSDPLAPPPNGQPAQPARPAQPAKPPKKPDEEEMKLTFVTFDKQMIANNRTNKANFWGNVRVLNMPSDNPQKEINMDGLLQNMPREVFFLSCEHLLVLTQKDNGRTSQEMEAKRRVHVESRDYEGFCDMLTYNETKDQIIFHGSPTEPARLYRALVPGGQREEMKGKKIIYLRTSGNFQVDGGDWFNGGNGSASPPRR